MESGRFTGELETAAFRLALLKVDALAEETRLPLATPARLLVEDAQECLKTIENAGGYSVAFPADGIRQCGACISGKMSPSYLPIFRTGQVVFDVVYTPLETKLLADARFQGL